MVRLRNRPGGNIISLAAEIYGTDDVSRLLRLIGANMPVSVPFDPMPERNTSPTEPEFGNVRIMPLAHPVLLDYLKSRKIDPRIAQTLCKEVRYTVRGKFYFAVGFANDNGGYVIRNRYFKGAILRRTRHGSDRRSRTGAAGCSRDLLITFRI